MNNVCVQMNASVSRIYIICTHSGKNTSRRLADDLKPLSLLSMLPEIAVTCIVQSVEEIDAAFNMIERDCIELKIKPLLHFDFHAHELHGLEITEKHFLSWEWLCYRARKINIAWTQWQKLQMESLFNLTHPNARGEDRYTMTMWQLLDEQPP